MHRENPLDADTAPKEGGHWFCPLRPPLRPLLAPTVILAVHCLLTQPASAQPAVPPVITYQGRLSASTTNFSGTGYFKFSIVGQSTNTYWSNSGATGASGEPTLPLTLTVSLGLFQANLGDADTVPLPLETFQNGDARLRIWFSPTVSGPFQELLPPQVLAASPYALIAARAAQAASVAGSNVVGTIPPGALGGALANPIVMTNPANVLAGDGAALVNLNANALASGTVADNRLSPNVALLNAPQTFTGQNTFQSPVGTGGTLQIGANVPGGSPKLISFGDVGYVTIGENAEDDRLEMHAGKYTLLNSSGPGYVGIGKTNPITALDVNGSIAATNFSGDGSGLTNLSGIQLANGSISSAQLAPGAAVGNLAPGSISATQLAAGAAAANLTPGAISSTQLAAGAAAANLAAGGQRGVASGGVILSENPTNSALIAAGYVKIGKLELVAEQWTAYAAGPPDVGTLNQARSDHSAVWTGSEMLVWGGYNGTYLNDGYRYNPAANTWTAMSHLNVPTPRADHCAVWTGSKMIVWGGADSTGGLYNPTTDTWSAMSTLNAPLGYALNAYGWSGTYFMVWGGWGDQTSIAPTGWVTSTYGTGARYNPSTDTWTPLATTGAPSARYSPAFVWTGTELVIWGGTYASACDSCQASTSLVFNSGGRYNPATDAWTTINTNGAPETRYGATAVWNGSQVLIWGGCDQYLVDLGPFGAAYSPTNLNTGGRYSPAGNSWSAMTTTGGPTGRHGHTALWTGSRMTIWGGQDDNGMANTGGRYDPAANTWTTTTTTGAPAARFNHTAVWTGTQMVIWGGADYFDSSVHFDGGGRYNITNDTWAAIAATPPSGDPGPRQKATAVWTGAEFIVWGGESGGLNLHSGGRINPALNTWTAPSLVGAPSGRIGHTAVWTGSAMVVWGGFDQAPTASGARYYPATDSWLPVSTTNAPAARARHTALWTGTEMLIWGGGGPGLGNYPATGGRYNPAADSWTATATNRNIVGRADHSAVWTGSEMIVWGGRSLSANLAFTYYATGYRYNPAADTWTVMPAASAPAARSLHTAVWTGSEMLVWGGYNGAALNTGGRYDTNSGWSNMSALNAPAARYSHAGFWDGSQMIVWGGTADGTNGLASGARWLPRTGEWTAITTANAPLPRAFHSAVWTGTEMYVWGGKSPAAGGTYFNDLESYTPQRLTYLYLLP